MTASACDANGGRQERELRKSSSTKRGRKLTPPSKYVLLVHQMSKYLTEKSKTISEKLSRSLQVDDNVSVNALHAARYFSFTYSSV